MTEEFDDFRAEEGVMLPHKYKINYLSSSNSGTYEFVWGVNISGYVFNKNLAADFFTFDENK
jgi:hypothetical protein